MRRWKIRRWVEQQGLSSVEAQAVEGVPTEPRRPGRSCGPRSTFDGVSPGMTYIIEQSSLDILYLYIVMGTARQRSFLRRNAGWPQVKLQIFPESVARPFERQI